jgi:hypothetical protein
MVGYLGEQGGSLGGETADRTNEALEGELTFVPALGATSFRVAHLVAVFSSALDSCHRVTTQHLFQYEA